MSLPVTQAAGSVPSTQHRWILISMNQAVENLNALSGVSSPLPVIGGYQGTSQLDEIVLNAVVIKHTTIL